MSDQQKRRSRVNVPAPVATPEVEETTIDLVELLYRLLAKWKMILCLALVFAIAMGAYTIYYITPLYRATSTIYVLSRRDSAINMADLQIGTVLTTDYLKVFSMWEVHEEVISNLGLPYSYSQMRGMLSVVNETDTRMLDISVTSPSAKEAADIANEYAKVASQFIADTMSMDKPNVMSVALVPANPISPNKTRNIMMGFLLGALLGMGIVTVRMLMDDKYKSAEDIRKYTGLVTLAMVPVEEETKHKKNAKAARRKA